MKHNACYFKISFDMTQYDSIWLSVYIWNSKQRKHKLIMESLTLPGLIRDFRIYFHNGYLNPYETVWRGRPSSKNMAQAVALWSGFSRSSWRSPERRRTRCWTWLEIVGNYCTDCGAASYFIGTVLSDTFRYFQYFQCLNAIFWYFLICWHLWTYGT